MALAPDVHDSPVASLDAAEATKLAILYYERFQAQLFCLLLVVTLSVICVDVWFLASDAWDYVAGAQGAPATGYFYFGRPANALVFDLGAHALAGLAVLIALANARATAQLQATRMKQVRLGVALLAVILVGLVCYQIGDLRKAERAAAWLAALFSVPFAHWASTLEMGLLVAVTLAQQLQFRRRVATHLSEGEAFLLRDDPSRTFKGRVFRSALGVPRIVDFLPSGRLRASAAFVLANAFYAVSALFFVPATIVAVVHWIDALQTCGLSKPACLEQKAFLYLALSALIAALALFIAPTVGALLSALGQKQVRLSVEELLARDERPPILFLRPFADDQVELPAAKVSFLARVGNWLAPVRNLDRLLLEECTPYGPVVAIGNPNDSFPPYGIARGYFDDKTWQGAVTDLARESVAIVICIDDFDGVWWEVENVVSRHLDKTLLLMHPRHIATGTSAGLLRRTAGKLGPERGARLLEAVDAVTATERGQRCLGAFIDPDGRLRLATSTTSSQLAFLLQARAFLRSKWGLAAGPVARA